MKDVPTRWGCPRTSFSNGGAQLRGLTVFEFRVEPVLDVRDAAAAEVDAIAWRDSMG